MSKSSNIASMYRKELDELKDSVIESIKFIALESKLQNIKLLDYNRTKLEFVYNKFDKGYIPIVYYVIDDSKNEIECKSISDLINILQLLEEKNYTILS